MKISCQLRAFIYQKLYFFFSYYKNEKIYNQNINFIEDDTYNDCDLNEVNIKN